MIGESMGGVQLTQALTIVKLGMGYYSLYFYYTLSFPNKMF